MKQNPDSWHKTMYDTNFALQTIGSNEWKKKAKLETQFLFDVLELKEKMTLLDVPCGTGRHSIEFARKGLKVTGIDISKDCIAIAKSKFSHKNTKYFVGDMANLKKYKNKFDVTINLFTSFGYFSTDSKNKNVLKELYHTLKPGGKIVLSLIDRDFLLKVYKPAMWHSKGNTTIIHASKYDPITKYNEAQMVYLNKTTGEGKNHYHRIRLYSKPEFLSLMKSVGFKKIRVYGNYQGDKFKKFESSHPIYIGEK